MTTDKNAKQTIPFNDSPTLRRSAKDQDRAVSAHFYAEKGARSNGAECWNLYAMKSQDRNGNRMYDVDTRETFDNWTSIYKFVEHVEGKVQIAEAEARQWYTSQGALHGRNLVAPEPPKDLARLKATRPPLPWIDIHTAISWYFDGYYEGARERANDNAGTELCGAIVYEAGGWPLKAKTCAQAPDHNGKHGEPEEIAPAVPAPTAKGGK